MAEEKTEPTKIEGVLTDEQEINALKAAYDFFVNFDRVPGAYAAQWANALESIAVVANSRFKKTKK